MIIFYVNGKLVDSVSSQEKKKSKLQQLLFIFALGVHFCLRQQQKSATTSVYTLACYIMHKVLVDFRFSLNLSAPLSYLWVVKLLWYFGTSLLVTKCQNFSFQFNLTLSLSRNSWNFLNFSFQIIFFYFPCEYFFVDLFVFSVYISEKLATNWNKIFPWIHFTASQQWCFLLNIQQWNILSRLQHSLSHL